MHMGGGLANDVVRGDVPSAFGHGVSPVILAPSGTGTNDGGGVDVSGAVVAVVSVVATFFLPPPLPDVVSSTTTMAMMARIGPHVKARVRCCRRRSIRRTASRRAS